MGGILAAQAAQKSWLQALALASGGRVFSTHGCDWAWLPTRRRLTLLFPDTIEDAGLRPALAEATRLGAVTVEAWLNAAVSDRPLREIGFVEQAPVLWHEGQVLPKRSDFDRLLFEGVAPRAKAPDAPRPWEGRVRLSAEVPEASDRDRTELRVTAQWRDAGPGRRHPATQRRIEHALAREEGALLGRAFGQFTLDGAVSLHGLAVAPAARRRGVGTALLRGLSDALAGSQLPPPSGSEAAQRAAHEPGRAPTLMVAATPSSADFFVAAGLRPLGRGRRLKLT